MPPARTTFPTIARYHAGDAFLAESVVKLLIALETLDRGGTPDVVAETLSRSGDHTATVLWNAGGGTAVVDRMVRRIGLSHTRPPDLPYMWGQTSVTAGDVAASYRYILRRAPRRQRATVLTALRNATPDGADGFSQYFGIPDAAGDRSWAVKQGRACCRPNRDLHTTGLLGTDDRYIVVASPSTPPTSPGAPPRTSSPSSYAAYYRPSHPDRGPGAGRGRRLPTRCGERSVHESRESSVRTVPGTTIDDRPLTTGASCVS